MATATVFLSVGGAAELVRQGSVEVLETVAKIPDPNDPILVTLRARPGSKQADYLQQKVSGDNLIVSGVLHLEDSQPILTPQVICKATEDQYFNEVVIVGNLSEKVRQAEKSCSRSMGESRPVRKGDDWEEHTDWFVVRGYGSANGNSSIKDRLTNAPKGSLIQVNGALSQRTSKTNEPYVEVKARSLRVHKRGGGSVPDPAADRDSVGYDHDSFTESQVDMPSDW